MVAMESKAIVLHRGFGSAAVDLQNLGVTIDSGDAYLAALKFENAVQAYQAIIPQVATIKAQVTSWPPEIDGVLPQLQALQWRFASLQTAHTAQDLAKLIQADLRGPVSTAPQITPATPVKAASTSTPTSVATAALWGLVAVGLGVMGWMIFKGPKENPTGGGGGGRKLGSKALIAKGRGVTFEMADGREIHCSGAMMHDPSGRWWPSKSVLIGPARLRQSKTDIEGDARAYFGRSDGHVGRVNTPPKPLKSWDYLGEVADIFYTRSGRRAGYYRHSFNEGLMSLLGGHKKVRLYKRGKFCRLELPRGAQLDDRGFVRP
jgi:hypothetical protein